jgi:hypothetical protein
VTATSDIRYTAITLLIAVVALAALGMCIHTGMTHLHASAGVTTTPTGPLR